MTSFIKVKAHDRKKPRPRYAVERASMKENLLGFVTHRQCLAALEQVLSEPLDRPEFEDMPEETRTRLRETY